MIDGIMPIRTGHRLPALLLATLALAWTLCAHAANPITKLITRDNVQIIGVMARQSAAGDVLLFTAQGPVRLGDRDIKARGLMIKEATTVNQLLTELEGNYRGRQTGRILTDKPFISKAIDDFEEAVRPDMLSSTTSDGNRAAIRGAVAYYRDKLNQIDATLAVLATADQITASARENEAGNLKWDADVLNRIIEQALVLNTQTRLPTPDILSDVDDARRRLELLLKAGGTAQMEAGLALFRDKGSTEQLVALLKQLGRVYPVEASVQQFQTRIITTILDKARATRDAAVARVDAGITYADGALQVDPKVFPSVNTQLDTASNSINDFRDGLFGEAAPALLKGLQMAVAANQEMARTANQRERAWRELGQTLNAAARAEVDGRSADAQTAYARALEQSAALGQGLPALERDMRFGVIRSRGRQIAARLNAPAGKTLAQLTQDLDDAAAFEQEVGVNFTPSGLDRPAWEVSIRRLKDFRTFVERYQRLQAEMTVQPVATWLRIADLDKFLVEHQDEIDANATAQWNAFLKANREPAFLNAVNAFAANPTAMKTDKDRELFASFLDYYKQRRDFPAAIQLLNRVLAKMREDAPQDPFIVHLLQEKLAIARILAESDNNEAAIEVFNEIKNDYPAFAGYHKDTLAAFIERKALSLRQSGKIAEAIERYESLCASYPEYAHERQLFVTLVDLQSQSLDKSDPMSETMLDFFEAKCAAYPGQLVKQADIVRYQKVFLARFDAIWKQEEGPLALEDTLSISNRYPNLARDTNLMDHVVRQVMQAGRELLLYKGTGNNTVIDTMKMMYRPEFDPFSKGPTRDELYVSLLLSRAHNYIDIRQYGKAFDIYTQIEHDFPALAQSKELSKIKDDQEWKLKIGRFQAPMQIDSTADWIALAAWLLIWGLLAYDVVRAGRHRGFMKYRLFQLATVFGTFAVVLAGLLFGAASHLTATLVALIVPGVLYNCLGFFTYRFFPLVYAERRLSFERLLFTIMGRSPLGRALAADITRIEEDMPLLHDRRLLMIERAKAVAASSPEKGYDTFTNVMKRLDMELIKDEKWKRIYHECILQRAHCAMKIGRRDEAIEQYETFLKFDQKNLAAHDILANEYYSRKNYDGAIPHLKMCLTGSAQDDLLWFRLGLCFFETSRPVAAYKCLETTTEKTREILFYTARAYARAGNMAKAIKLFQKLLKDNASDGEAIYFLSSTLATGNEDVKALKVMRLVPADHPVYPRILALEGNLLLRNGKFDKARQSFMDAIKLDPTLHSAYLGLGQLLVENGHDNQAMELFQDVINKQPDHVAAHYYMGVIVEKSDPSKAVVHFEKARANDTFKARACRRLGRLYFQSRDFNRAVEMFEEAAADYDQGASVPPWFLYLHAFTLAQQGNQTRCEQVLIKLLGQTTEDASWTAQSPRAMYTIGVTLFGAQNYRMAYQCFEYARATYTSGAEAAHLDELLRETRFRLVVKLTEAGDMIEAQAQLLELQESPLSPSRLETCAYYTGLNQLYLQAYDAAEEVFGHLYRANPQDVRAGYHLAAALLGSGQTEQAEAFLKSLDGHPALPYHLKIGIVSMRALMSARQGDYAQAEARLATLPPPAAGDRGVEYVRSKISLARVFYLCHSGDSPKIQFVMADMPDTVRGQAAYLQAVANLQSGRLVTVINNLHPYAHLSDTNNRLFTSLAIRHALTVLEKDQVAESQKILKLIPQPVQGIRDLLFLFDHNALIDAAPRSREELDVTLKGLKKLNAKAVDKLLLHTINHNLHIYELQRAIAAEEADSPDVDEIWQECLLNWQQSLFGHKSYWNLAQERLAVTEASVKHFNAHEIEVINQRIKEDCLIRVFRGYSIAYLRLGDFANAKRHLGMIRMLGEEDGKLTVYMSLVLDEMEQTLRRIDRNDPISNTWEFVVTSLALQLEINDVLATDSGDLKKQLELYLKAREQFATPSEFNKERRAFNTQFLEALQIGIKGNFFTAGDRIDKCLTALPLGVNLGELQQPLYQLREYCRNPERTEQQGVRLEREFEKLYQKVRTFDFTRGVVVNAAT